MRYAQRLTSLLYGQLLASLLYRDGTPCRAMVMLPAVAEHACSHQAKLVSGLLGSRQPACQHLKVLL